jgi:hypothetical protein
MPLAATVEQPAAVDQPASINEPTMTSPATPAQSTIYHCTIIKDFFMPTLDMDFKKGMPGQLSVEWEMRDGRKMVKMFVEGVTNQLGGDVVNVWVPKECVERGSRVE